MKEFFESLRDDTIKINSFEKKKKKKMNRKNHLKMQRCAIFGKKNVKIEMVKVKDIVKLEIIVFVQFTIEVLPIAYVI